MVTPQNLLALKRLQLVYKGELHFFPYQTDEIEVENDLELSLNDINCHTADFS